MEPQETDTVTENGHDEDASPGSVLDTIRQARRDIAAAREEAQVFEVPGYLGLLAIEYRYIDTDVTEKLAKKVVRETRHVHGEGESLLASIDTLTKACKRVVIRDKVGDEWRSIREGSDVRLTPELAEILAYPARDDREAVLGLFGTEHAIIQQNVQLSRWLADVTRKSDEDFLG